MSEYLAALAIQNSQTGGGALVPAPGSVSAGVNSDLSNLISTPEAETNAVKEMLMNFEVGNQADSPVVTRAGDLLMWILNLELRLPPYGDLTQAKS
ncbi:MAG: hypothetical protein IAF58_20135 [Leptolyngbya sp.]|nr:hypothetical protein [Candidatus Melainabacteria bacterium]